ncbi:MAG: NYN domain-containing protein [Bacteroidales bacterium]|nr:NYN domain-containing protein [Bacteroidales bacterium]
MNNTSGVKRIGVIYDGNYLYHVSNYYNYNHSRKSRINISGLHAFIRHKVAELEDQSFGLCQIVDAHYFRTRLNAKEASQKGNLLYYDRVFDDILMSEGVTTHYIPLRTLQGQMEDKGIEVWLALEAFELSLHKAFDVLVIIAGDEDYVALARKINTLGTRVMLLSWDFKYTDNSGNERMVRTSQDLLDVVTYPIEMNEIIDDPDNRKDPVVNSLFVAHKHVASRLPKYVEDEGEGYTTSEVLSIKEGYGFIHFPPDNLFFHFSNLHGIDFNDIRPGDPVRFRIVLNEDGREVATDVEFIEE